MVELKYRMVDERTREERWVVEGTFANAAIARIVAFRSGVPMRDVRVVPTEETAVE